jgi:uncharacterized protein YecE (DUF72 family)
VYVRRHGTSPRRYHGAYTETMLRADGRRILEWLRAGLDVYVYFNNDFEGHAWRNALRLKTLLARRWPTPPSGASGAAGRSARLTGGGSSARPSR